MLSQFLKDDGLGSKGAFTIALASPSFPLFGRSWPNEQLNPLVAPLPPLSKALISSEVPGALAERAQAEQGIPSDPSSNFSGGHALRSNWSVCALSFSAKAGELSNQCRANAKQCVLVTCKVHKSNFQDLHFVIRQYLEHRTF